VIRAKSAHTESMHPERANTCHPEGSHQLSS
jgi:hypothetical protein